MEDVEEPREREVRGKEKRGRKGKREMRDRERKGKEECDRKGEERKKGAEGGREGGRGGEEKEGRSLQLS